MILLRQGTLAKKVVKKLRILASLSENKSI